MFLIKNSFLCMLLVSLVSANNIQAGMPIVQIILGDSILTAVAGVIVAKHIDSKAKSELTLRYPRIMERFSKDSSMYSALLPVALPIGASLSLGGRFAFITSFRTLVGAIVLAPVGCALEVVGYGLRMHNLEKSEMENLKNDVQSCVADKQSR